MAVTGVVAAPALWCVLPGPCPRLPPASSPLQPKPSLEPSVRGLWRGPVNSRRIRFPLKWTGGGGMLGQRQIALSSMGDIFVERHFQGEMYITMKI